MPHAQNQFPLSQLSEPFLIHLIKNFQAYCTEKRLRPNISNLLNFLLQHQLFDADTIRHYVVLNEFEAWTKSSHFSNKTQTIRQIAVRYSLHENTIWNILKDHKHKFQQHL